jgi:hypothetical protein
MPDPGLPTAGATARRIRQPHDAPAAAHDLAAVRAQMKNARACVSNASCHFSNDSSVAITCS